MSHAPVLFISHGAPTFALEPGRLGPQLQSLGSTLRNVAAVLVVSPHWQSRSVQVTMTERPETLHDFGGFPAPLYRLQYPAAGAPAVAAQALAALARAGVSATADAQRGLDHGAWVPLWHLLPGAPLPVLQVSMPIDLDAAAAFRLGTALAPLREQGVLIVGSGSMTHNLYELHPPGSAPAPYAEQFAGWVQQAVARGDVEALVDYRARAPHAVRAHPSDEHFLPLLVALGASRAGEVARWLEGGVTYGVLSMDSYAWGTAA